MPKAKSMEQKEGPVSRQLLPFLYEDWLRNLGVKDTCEILSAMRPEEEVTTPEAMRSIKATRVSFARTLLDRMTTEKWKISLKTADVGEDGAGLLVYEIEANLNKMQFGVKSMQSEGIDRVGRLADMQYDFYAVLCEGDVSDVAIQNDLDGLRASLWSARTDNRTIGFTVANRSVSNFAHIVASLAQEKQPDPVQLMSNGGYIIRNAGWYGNGRHGTRSWKSMAEHALGLPYHPDMFALFLFRIASFDLAEATARARNPRAISLSASIKRMLGVGNSSGMGMVAALVRWPEWFGAYNLIRELCLAYAVTRPTIDRARAKRLVDLLRRASAYHHSQPESPIEGFTHPQVLSLHLAGVAEAATKYADAVAGDIPKYPLKALATFAAGLDRETYEQTNAILVDLFPKFAAAATTDLLPQSMNIERTVDAQMAVSELTALIDKRYGWALQIDLAAPGAREYFWYRSEDNGENRRGERVVDPGVEHETFVDVAGDVQRLRAYLNTRPAT